MKKTISYLFLVMIITGTLFTACGPVVEDPNAKDVDGDEGSEEVGDADEDEDEDEDKGEAGDKDDDKAVENANSVQKELIKEPVKDPVKEPVSEPVKKPAEEPVKEPVSEPVKKPAEEPVKEPASEPVVTTKYIDGTYTKTGSYQSPAGPESIAVTVTVENDVVKSLAVTPNAVNETSKTYQGLFAQGVNSLVAGKNIDEVGGFSQVNGSSLTSGGFNSAFAAVKASSKR